MRVVFEGAVHVEYMQMYVEGREGWPSFESGHSAGQVNGLCGAANEGFLFLTTGMHTGDVALRIEVHEHEPELNDHWEDIVEASFWPQARTVYLAQWGDAPACEFELALVPHRVRYCATGMDAANAHGVVFRGQTPVDRYLLQFWPAPRAADRVIKQTSRQAAYWHRVARDTPPPPTPEEKAEAERLVREEKARAAAEARRTFELRMWGGRPPSDRLRNVGGNVHGLRMLDVYLVHDIDRMPNDTQRAIARWAAHRACQEAQLTRADWISAALQALDDGLPLPALFGDHAALWQRLFNDERIPSTTVAYPSGGPQRMSQQAMALPTLTAAAEPDPLQAALDALHAAAATYGAACPSLFSDVRQAFPELGPAPAPPIEPPPPPFLFVFDA